MSWNDLRNPNGLIEVIQASNTKPQIIFKHSTRCGISAGARKRLRKFEVQLERIFGLNSLDLIRYRLVSDEVARRLNVPHKSPQLIVIRDGKAMFSLTHSKIQFAHIISTMKLAEAKLNSDTSDS